MYGTVGQGLCGKGGGVGRVDVCMMREEQVTRYMQACYVES